MDLQVARQGSLSCEALVADGADVALYSQVDAHVSPKGRDAHDRLVADVALDQGGALVDFGARRGVGVVFADGLFIDTSVWQFVLSNCPSWSIFSTFLPDGCFSSVRMLCCRF